MISNKLFLSLLVFAVSTTNAHALFGGLIGGSPEYDDDKPGTFLEQLATKKKYPKEPYTPPKELLLPYSNASLDKPVADAVNKNISLIKVPAVQKYCQGIVDKLLVNWQGAKPEQIKVYVRDSPYYGASATPSGVILVNIGTFSPDDKGVTYENELALLLGHEVGHILLHHLDRNKYMDKVVKGVKFAAATSLQYASIKNTSIKNKKLDIKGDSENAMNNFKSGLALNIFASDIVNPIWKRSQEENADIIGADLANAAGYIVDKAIAKKFIYKHSEDLERRSRENEALRLLMKEQVKTEAKKVVIKDTGMSQVGSLLQEAKSTVTDKSVDALFVGLSKLNKDHPTREERYDVFRSYIVKSYPKKGLVKHDKNAIKRISHAQNIVTLISKLRYMNDISDKIIYNDNEKSAEQMVNEVKVIGKRQRYVKTRKSTRPVKESKIQSSLLQTNFVTDQAPQTLYVSGMMEGMLNHQKTALHRLEVGAKSDYATVSHIQALGKLYFESKNKHKLGKLISRTNKLIGTSEPLIDLIVADQVLQGNVGQAEVSAAQCLDYNKGILYPICVSFLGYDPQSEEGAKTPEGKKAFQGKSFFKSIKKGFNVFGDLL